MGLGFLYKSFTGTNNETQIKEVFWHETRIIHAILFILGSYTYNNYKLSCSFLYLDMQTNPASAYIRFETKIADGDKKLF